MGSLRHAWLAALGLALSLSAQDNVLIVVADDVGIDQIGAYGLGGDLPPTPNLDALAANGVLFRNAYSNPVCSPTRVQVLTGRHSYRHGIGHIVGPEMISPELFALPLEETILPEMLDLGTGGMYDHAAIGKWHLYEGLGFETAPNDAGFNHFAGTPSNLGFDPQAYYNWIKVVDGTFFVSTTYATTDQVNEALAFMTSAPEPWLCYVAFSAAHVPFHEPPASLHTQDLSSAGPPDLDPRPYYKATVEAIDTEFGRMISGMGSLADRTNIFFLGDNGTPPEAVVPPFDPSHAKATLYDGGCHVPFVVGGPAVGAPGESSALVSMTDIYATVAELAAVDLQAVQPRDYPLDSVSLVPYLQNPAAPSLRDTVFAQLFGPIGSGPYSLDGYMLRDERYKLIRVFTPGLPGYPAEFYDLWTDPHEQQNLILGGITLDELDRYRELDLMGRDLVRPAALAGPSGSEDHVLLASNAPAGGGESQSPQYRVVSQAGRVIGPAASSTNFKTLGGTSWTTGGISTDHPVLFGLEVDRGDKAGGTATTMFGFGLNELTTTSTLDLDLGGRNVSALTVVNGTSATLNTPSGSSALSNPAGAQNLALVTDDGPVILPRAFTYLPALGTRGPQRVGEDFHLRMVVEAGHGLVVFWGTALPGLGVAVPPFSGQFELLGSSGMLLEPSIPVDGEETFVAPVPDTPAAVGLTLDFQGLGGPLTDLSQGGWTNRLRVTLLPSP